MKGCADAGGRVPVDRLGFLPLLGEAVILQSAHPLLSLSLSLSHGQGNDGLLRGSLLAGSVLGYEACVCLYL